jgi:hypothetical protein
LVDGDSYDIATFFKNMGMNGDAYVQVGKLSHFKSIHTPKKERESHRVAGDMYARLLKHHFH